MHTTLVEQGLQLLVGGLGTVFFFLSILTSNNSFFGLSYQLLFTIL